jgi:hypothetical protein
MNGPRLTLYALRFAFYTLRLLPLALLVLLPALALAQTGGGYELTWNTIDGGGYTWSVGSGYALGGTIGQADAGVLTGGGYTLGGGFWRGGTASQHHIYLPLVLRVVP